MGAAPAYGSVRRLLTRLRSARGRRRAGEVDETQNALDEPLLPQSLGEREGAEEAGQDVGVTGATVWGALGGRQEEAPAPRPAEGKAGPWAGRGGGEPRSVCVASLRAWVSRSSPGVCGGAHPRCVPPSSPWNAASPSLIKGERARLGARSLSRPTAQLPRAACGNGGPHTFPARVPRACESEASRVSASPAFVGAPPEATKTFLSKAPRTKRKPVAGSWCPKGKLSTKSRRDHRHSTVMISRGLGTWSATRGPGRDTCMTQPHGAWV